MKNRDTSRVLTGEGVSPGVGIGRLWRVGTGIADDADYRPGSLEEESARLHAAVKKTAQQLQQSAKALRAQGQETAADIMEVHALLAKDPLLLEAVEKKLHAQKDAPSAPKAVRTAAKEQAALLFAVDDPYIRERAADVRCVGTTLVKALLGRNDAPPPAGVLILVGDDITPAAFAALPEKRVGGMIFSAGSRTAHSAILARAKGLPAVIGLGEALHEVGAGDLVIVDGDTGRVTAAPTPANKKAAREAMRRWQEKCQAMATLAKEPAMTKDGAPITLAGNAGSAADVVAAMEAGADGIGLFRSEFLFLGRETFPTEEEQYAAYRAAVEAAKGRRCVIRTLDAGADKAIPALHLPPEENPALGQRGIRVSLAHPALLKSQLRAILRAGSAGSVGLLLPFVVSGEEITAVKALLAEAKEELARAHLPFAAHVPLGLTVETPAAAIMADRLAKEVDFFSIGTNDLTQYTLAADRTNPASDAMGGWLHPAVLRLIARTAKAGKDAGIPVTVCGEMAADPLSLPLLVGMGIQILSMDAPSLLFLRAAVHRLSARDARRLWGHVQTLDSAADIRAYVSAEAEKRAANTAP
ncbi:MAG: phosphoenolpyruvate--protein phosphotransferase [Schwartzia sp. (in: firmicutes)]